MCATVGRPPCYRRNGSILARLFHAENALASRPRRLSIRQAVTPEANAATIGSGQPFDRAGSVPPDSGKPSAPVSNPADIETPPPSEAGNRSTVANIERAAQPFAPQTPLQAVATVRRLSVRHHRPRRRKRPACQRFRPMSANAAPPVRCKSNPAAFFVYTCRAFTLAAPVPCLQCPRRLSGVNQIPQHFSLHLPRRRIPASVRHHRQAAPEASAPVYPASRPRRPLSIYRKPRPLPFRRHRSPVYPASRPPFDRAPRNRLRDRFGNVTRANRGDRGDRVPEASAPVNLSGNRSTAPPPSASRHAGSERRHHRPRRKRPACQRFDRGDRAPPVSGQAVRHHRKRRPFDRAAGFRQAVTPEASGLSAIPANVRRFSPPCAQPLAVRLAIAATVRFSPAYFAPKTPLQAVATVCRVTLPAC